ncbi:MAG: hypothetical protein O3C60_04590 [Planctomycetota bacterium]|nr:hypothetical protein [Planctomycetota bacterium]
MVPIALCLCVSVLNIIFVDGIVVDGEREPVVWQTQYADAVRLAQAEERMLLIYFADRQPNRAGKNLEQRTLQDSALSQALREHVCLKLSIDTVQDDLKDSKPLVRHPAFRYMHGGAGMAVIDFHDRDSPHWSMVVTQLPFAVIGYPDVKKSLFRRIRG